MPAQNSISCEIRGRRRVRGDETDEPSRTPTIPDGVGQSERQLLAIGIQHAMARAAAQGRAWEIVQPSKADQAARRS